MKIAVLTENTSRSERITAEHGLSLYIEVNNRRILFDMGQTDTFIKNAKAMGIDLKTVDAAIISHGHYDHGGGLEAFLNLNKSAPVYIRKNAFLPYYNTPNKYIGLNTALIGTERIIFTDGKYDIGNGMTLYSATEDQKKIPTVPHSLLLRTENGFIRDGFTHEQYLEITEGERRILISGCSHAGIIGIAERFHPDALIGGFHLSALSAGEKLVSVARELSEQKTDFYTCHCTGYEQFLFMKKLMPHLSYVSAGDILNI